MLTDENNVIALKSLENQVWITYVTHDGLTDEFTCSFGGVVFRILNIINSFINKKSECYNYPDNETEHITKLIENDPQLVKFFQELCESLLERDGLSKKQRFEFYKRFMYLGPAFFQGIDSSKIYESIRDKTDLFDQSEHIRVLGEEMINGIIYEKYLLTDGTWLFPLDLWLCFFDEAILPTKCQYCGNFFMAPSKKFKFCPECNDPKAKNKRNYEKRKNDPVQYYRKRINTIMEDRGLPTWEFNKELDYYLDLLKGKTQTRDSRYRKIETKEELIKWLKEKHEGLLKNKKRKDECNGKTNEKGKRDRSDR